MTAADGDIRLLRRRDNAFFFKQPFRVRSPGRWLTVCKNHHALQLSRFGKFGTYYPKLYVDTR
jgi:hypothetical protein